jgi:hypothetical protein
MPETLSPWTSSSCRPSSSVCSSSSSCSATTAANSSTSTSPTLPRPSGPPGRSSRRSPRHGPEVLAPSSRRNLRRRLWAASQAPGDPRGPHRPAGALAEPTRGAADRLNPPGMPRPRLHPERGSSPPSPERLRHYNTTRPHQALDNHCPRPREVKPPALGRIVAIPQVGGLITATPASPEHGQPAGQPSSAL